MERERPPYLGDLPRDRRGNWAMYLLAAGLLAALIGGWKIYAGTVAAWHARYQQPASRVTVPEQARDVSPERLQQLEALAEQRRRQYEHQQQERQKWKCVAGTPFRPLPGGGWENVPGEHC